MSFCNFQAARIVKPLDSDTFVTYQITAATPALFFPRDFVYGVKFGKTKIFFFPPNATMIHKVKALRVDDMYFLVSNIFLLLCNGLFFTTSYFFLSHSFSHTQDLLSWSKGQKKVGGYFWPFGTISTYSILKRFVATCQITENDQEVWLVTTIRYREYYVFGQNRTTARRIFFCS